jgi:hypothetical protein
LCAERSVVHIHAVAEMVVGKLIEAGDQDAAHGYAKRDVNGIVHQAPSVWITGRIAAD